MVTIPDSTHDTQPEVSSTQSVSRAQFPQTGKSWNQQEGKLRNPYAVRIRSGAHAQALHPSSIDRPRHACWIIITQFCGSVVRQERKREQYMHA